MTRIDLASIMIPRGVRRPLLAWLARLATIASLAGPGVAQEVAVLRDVTVIDGTGRPLPPA